MNPAQKALWYIESHLAEALTLDEIAAIGGVSRFHMVRAFARRDGFSVMRYVRRPPPQQRRRARSRPARPTFSASRWMRITALTKHSPARSATISASRPRSVRGRNVPRSSQASGADPHGFNLTRSSQGPAFRDRQGLACRRRRRTHTICENNGAGIPSQWQRFHQTVDNVPGRIGKVAYGVCCNGDDAGNFDYIAGVEVDRLLRPAARISAGVRIPSRNMPCLLTPSTSRPFAAPSTRSGITGCRASGMKAADAPNFERYDEKFDPLTGNGGLEIWIPVRD